MAGTDATLLSRLAERRSLVVAGVFDALSAVLAQRAGFEGVFLSGSALAQTQLGRPDVGLFSLTELVDVVGRVSARVDVPVLVDADFGFGNAINVYRTVQSLERAGASGIQLEDRLESAPPADMARRPVVGTAIMVDKIRAAADARDSTGTVISARTDALFSSGLDETLDRAERYIDAGADMIFVEGCIKDSDRRAVIDRLSGLRPVLFNAGILDSAQLPDYEDLAQLGYAMILFPGTAIAAAAAGMHNALAELQAWVGGGDRFSPPKFDLGASIDAGAFLDKFS